jgi:hypothetical protein
MNLDELFESIPNSDIELKNQLKVFISDWKRNSTSLEELTSMIGKWHGNVWFSTDKTSNQFYENWNEFKENAINSIGGMTMNERLYRFGLFEIWDKSNTEDQERIRFKLKADY